ncbi:MAG: PAS domain-containing protein [Rhodobiaceae bacterium]|nr:PAS domain protein [Rhodobiaceae bacterium]MCR9242356.1 PAS domain-containing protein [Rhodobiaceae bacterium]
MDLKTEGARTLLAYWESQKGDGRLPSTAHLDLVDLAPILSNMVIYEHGGGDFTTRFFGTEMVRRLGVDLTGTKTSTFMELPFGKLIIDHLNQVISGPAMLTSEYHSQTNEGPVLEIEQIMLPWENEEGQAQCVLSHVTRTSGEDSTLTLKLEESFIDLINLQTISL